MGEGAAETVREIEATRRRLETEIQELEERLPRPAIWGKRAAAVAAGGGAGGAVFWFAVRRLKARRRKKREATQLLAPAGNAGRVIAAVAPVDLSTMLPKEVRAALEDGTWKRWAAALGALWAATRMAELRHLRRLAASQRAG